MAVFVTKKTKYNPYQSGVAWQLQAGPESVSWP